MSVMKAFLLRIGACFRRAPGVPAGKAGAAGRHSEAGACVLLDRVAPRKAAPEAQNAFVRREAILSRDGRIAAYEFFTLDRMQASASPGLKQELIRQADEAALLKWMMVQGVDSLLGQRLAFIQLAASSLGNLRLSQLPVRNTVLIVPLTAHAEALDSLTASFARLREEGFRVGLLVDRVVGITAALLEQVDFIQIDVLAFDGIDLRTVTRSLNARRKAGKRPLLLAARNVQSHDDYQFCHRCGFHLFQGPFVSSRESLKPMPAKINRLALLPILNMVMEERSFAETAAQLASEPVMSFKLLRYLNSAAMGLQQPISNLTEALVLLGRDKFYRWTSLLLFEFAEPDYSQRLLAERALTRGRTLELLAGKGQIPHDGDKLFLLGLFSLLDEAFGRPLAELLTQVVLPEQVRDALLGHPGAYSDALRLAILGEADSSTPLVHIAETLQRCAVKVDDFMAVAAQALVWANQMLEGEAPAESAAA